MAELQVNYYAAAEPIYSAAFVAYKNRVLAAGGTIASSPDTSDALAWLAANPDANLVQWLDSRFGVGPAWFSLLGAASDAARGRYGNATFAVDATISQPVFQKGAFVGPAQADIPVASSYTWGMRYLQPSGEGGFFWGDRYGNSSGSAWSYLSSGLWRSYNNGNDKTIALSLPVGVWSWVWVVKNGANVSIYDHTNALLGSVTLTAPIGNLPFGIAGGSDSSGICAVLKYETFVRASTALTAAQRAAIQAN